ncbi:hypothetical protein KIW84_032693 [Lathyrus oleraceus]|uniref:Replication protein A 70 kDa DNA-binding subunit B/D first OB fold domain-containing protein n=1 Tax=Pisum sativum TaxID=3888 RepID=A0A9D4XUX1_PEA|nr:hypothetical protein KIW84_032693 [Pisum sativum]
MSRKVDPVKDINDSKETWRLAIRIMDVWSVVNNKGIEHLEMIVMDSLGDRIHVLIRHDHLLKWKEVIKENMTCIINNGSVYNNDFQWKVCDHSKKIVFLGGTTMKAIELQNIPPKGYFFKDFGEILQGKCKTDRLEDIIGAVSEINHIQSNTPGKKVVVSIVLKDLKGNCINCNLWEIYGSKFLAYYNDPKNNGAIVILLTHAMVKDGQVSNAWSGSKLLINEDIPEIQDFMSKLPTNEQKEKPTQSAKSLSNWSGGSQYSPVERFVHNAKCMSLSQFCKIKHETLCVTVATTLKFAVSKYGWFYYGCTRCSSKAPNPEKAYECSCGQKVKQPIPRYKIEIYVSNGESKYRFVFWDSECAAILGMTAEFMHNSMVENGEDDPMVYPDELEMLLNKKMAFRVKFQPETIVDQNGFPVYRRRDNGHTVLKNGIQVDNRNVVPYNTKLLTKYQAHINMEWCNQSTSIKYLFKYINKGYDRITAAIVPNDDGTSNQPQNIDEIKHYIDCRYVSPSEASWRIFSFPIHGRKPTVERMYFHCEGQNSVYYTDFDRINTVLEKPSVTESMFTSWFEANCKYPEAQNLTYSKFVSKIVYVKKKREWKPRQKGYTIGRLIWVPPTTGELYYLRLMLTHVKVPRSYNDIKTVNNVKYDTFRDACFAMGFIGDDREFIAAIKEANHWGSDQYLRLLFVHMLLSGIINRPRHVWSKTCHLLADGILYAQQRIANNRGGTVDGQAKGLSSIECPKEFNKKKLKRLGDRVPLTMVELTEKGSEIATKASKSTKESTDPQEKNSSKPSNDVLNVVPIQVVFL